MNNFFSNFRLIPTDTSYAILIRHAERYKIATGKIGNDVSITSKGIIESRNFGFNLSNCRINSIYSSPVLRCIETAKEISYGASITKLNILTRNKLRGPGPYIGDPL